MRNKNLSKGMLQLILEEDINCKKSRLIAEIPIDENRRFKFEKELPPHIYSLKINDKRSVKLTIEKGQVGLESGKETWLRVMEQDKRI